MKKNGLEIAINLLFWVCTGWFILTFFSVESQEITMEDDGFESIKTIRNFNLVYLLLLTLLLSGVLFYAHLAIIHRLQKGEKLLRVMLLSAGALLLALLLNTLFSKALFDFNVGLPLPLTLGIFFFYYAVSGGYGIGKVWLGTELKRQQLVVEKKQAELNLLRLQLHPHFLFNVLNNLLSMVDQEKDPRMAESIDRLSGMLRYVVYETEKEKVDLAKEVDFIRNYAALQLMRYEKDEIDFQLTVEGPYDGQSVAPGIFVPFVENAFKHGVQPEERSFVHIRFNLEREGQLVFIIENSLHPDYPPQAPGGTGLASTRKRLQLLYPHQHQLTIGEEDTFLLKLVLEI